MDPGDPFQYMNKYALGSGATLGTGKVVETYVYQANVANPIITWEKQTTYNLGFDSKFMDNAFHLNTEFFYSKRSDILTARNASVPGFTSTLPAWSLSAPASRRALRPPSPAWPTPP